LVLKEKTHKAARGPTSSALIEGKDMDIKKNPEEKRAKRALENKRKGSTALLAKRRLNVTGEEKMVRNLGSKKKRPTPKTGSETGNLASQEKIKSQQGR